MGATEIILIVIGIVVFLLGYLMPARKKDIDEEVKLISEDEIRKMVSGEMGHVKDRIDDIVEETVSYSMEKTERAMERLTNEKIMAINEYSDTVLEEINKNHKEVVFLYDMLNDKHDNLMTTVNEATAASDGVKETLKDAENTVSEATDKADDVLRAVDEASARINDVLRAADEAVKGVWDAQNAARVAREAAQEAIRIASELAETRMTETHIPSETKTVPGEGLREVRQMQRTPDQDIPERAADVSVEEAAESNAPVMAKGDDVSVEQQSDPNEMEEQPGGWITAADLKEEAAGTETPTEQEFKPIAPKRVEIVHEPDDLPGEAEEKQGPAGAALASLGIFAPKQETEEKPDRRFGLREEMDEDLAEGTEQTGTGARESTPTVDIQFAKNNGRNSNERILELHKAGRSNMAIAKELGLSLGEVKLVIDLFEGV